MKAKVTIKRDNRGGQPGEKLFSVKVGQVVCETEYMWIIKFDNYIESYHKRGDDGVTVEVI